MPVTARKKAVSTIADDVLLIFHSLQASTQVFNTLGEVRFAECSNYSACNSIAQVFFSKNWTNKASN